MRPPSENETAVGVQKHPTGLEADHASKRIDDKVITPRRFAVVCRRDDGGERVFGRYAQRHEAEHYAVSLTRVGCPADVRELVEAAPEFGASRRKFLIAMFMCGAVNGERVVERIVSEIRGETT